MTVNQNAPLYTRRHCSNTTIYNNNRSSQCVSVPVEHTVGVDHFGPALRVSQHALNPVDHYLHQVVVNGLLEKPAQSHKIACILSELCYKNVWTGMLCCEEFSPIEEAQHIQM